MQRETNLLIKIVIFTVTQGKLLVYVEKESLPTSKIEEGKSLDVTARQLLRNTIGITAKETYIEQLYTFGKREKSEIVVGYYMLTPYHLLKDSHSNWIDATILARGGLAKGGVMGRKDREILAYAVQRLRWKIEYTNVVYSLLPSDFTLSELQEVYEVILGKQLDKRNFRKKILSLHIVKSTGKVRKGLAARPPQVYAFRKRSPVMVKVFA